MKFAICTPREGEGRELLAILERRLRQLSADIDTAIFKSGEELLAALHPGSFAVLFLEAGMDGMDDLSVARRARRLDPGCQLIILADNAADAIRSYSVHPVGYLVKPFDAEAIFKTLDWCRHAWSAGLRTVAVTVNRAEARIPMTDIFYAEICGRSLAIHTRRDSIMVNMSMSEFQRRTAEGPFLRCQKSYIVNMHHIMGAEAGGFIMDNGERIPLSTERKKQVMEAYDLFVKTCENCEILA